MSDPEYYKINSQMAASHALTDLPEAHGTLAGALCASALFSFEDWLRETYAKGLAGEAQIAMQSVFEWTQHTLQEGQLQFQLLLPEEPQLVAERAISLGQWCQGFLYGLGTNEIPDIDKLPAEVAEIVRDLTAITQVSVDRNESDEENEQAYVELVEFVRVGVQLLFDELAPFRIAQESTGYADVPPAQIH